MADDEVGFLFFFKVSATLTSSSVARKEERETKLIVAATGSFKAPPVLLLRGYLFC